MHAPGQGRFKLSNPNTAQKYQNCANIKDLSNPAVQQPIEVITQFTTVLTVLHLFQTSQVSRLRRESHASRLNLTISRLRVFKLTPSTSVLAATNLQSRSCESDLRKITRAHEWSELDTPSYL